MIIFIDIDKTICNPPDDLNYENCIPIRKNIYKANKLFFIGHHIVYWTARGSQSGVDWSKFTKKQLSQWGVKYDELRFDKPYFDLLIDDKTLNVKDWK